MTTITVPIEKEANNFCIYPSLFGTALSYQIKPDELERRSIEVSETEEDFSILGKLSELATWERQSELAPFVGRKKSSWGIGFYIDYENNPEGKPRKNGFDTPMQSFISKLKSEGKICKWMLPSPVEHSIREYETSVELTRAEKETQADFEFYNSIPDDFLILIKK